MVTIAVFTSGFTPAPFFVNPFTIYYYPFYSVICFTAPSARFQFIFFLLSFSRPDQAARVRLPLPPGPPFYAPL